MGEKRDIMHTKTCVSYADLTIARRKNMSRAKKRIVEFRSYSLMPDFPVVVLTGENWRISPNISPRLHFHNSLEIGMCHEGGGCMVFPSGTVHFSAGDVVCVDRNVSHTTYSDPGTRSLWSYIYVDPALLFYGDAFPKHHQLPALPSQTLFTGEAAEAIREPFQCVLKEYNAKQKGYETAIQAYCVQLLLAMYRRTAAESSTADQVHSVEAIAPALEYIRTSYALDFPMEYLAELCHLSPTHFRRLFREETGLSPIAFVNRTRILESCTLLRTTGKSIAEIAGAVGFVTLSSYNRHFADVVGSSPSTWRKTAKVPSRQTVVGFSGWTEAEE